VIDLSSVDVPDMLERLGMSNVRLTSGGREANFSCFKPGHAHGDERPSAYMNVETTAGWCFGCHSRWSAVSFVAEARDVSTADAQQWLRSTYGIEFVEPLDGSMVGELERRFRPREPVLPRRVKPSASWLSMLSLDWHDSTEIEQDQGYARYILDRGLSPEILSSFGVGYDYLCDRITIPVYDLAGELVGIKGRAWNGREPKYLVLGDRGESTKFGFHPYEASEVVFGLDRHRDKDIAVVFEGELDAMACEQAMIEHGAHVARACAIGMSYMSRRHAELLIREVDHVYLFRPRRGRRGLVRGHVDSRGDRQPGAIDLLEPHVGVWVVRGQEHDAAEYVRRGESARVIELIRSARSSVAISSYHDKIVIDGPVRVSGIGWSQPEQHRKAAMTYR
jgi:DNA primase